MPSHKIMSGGDKSMQDVPRATDRKQLGTSDKEIQKELLEVGTSGREANAGPEICSEVSGQSYLGTCPVLRDQDFLPDTVPGLRSQLGPWPCCPHSPASPLQSCPFIY